MKTLGIIGGIAPPSTVDYYLRLTSGYRALSPVGSYPSLLLNSIDATHFFPMVLADDRAPLIEFLVAAVDRLARGGADGALFASNTPHIVFDEVAARSPIPLISIVEETARVAQARGFRRVGLLGLRPTVEGHFYPDAMARRGITVAVPSEDDRAYVHAHYLGELVEGVFLDETRAGIAAVVQRLHALDQLDAVILGGTELSVLFRDGTGLPVPVLDPTAIHVEAAIAWLITQ